ncbi:MAG: NadR type nicotinamide-nucleotide adenylyltransferase [Crocinitomicaceae bacterium]|jgi:NadR type nicotinamide-nucleotide adenylyltransferase
MIRIALTGPESSGKTTLSEALTSELKGILVPEFARAYLSKINHEYRQEDLNKIAHGHLESFLNLDNSVQIIDTDFIVLKIWSDEKYGTSSAYIEELVGKNHFDLHILCSPDIPWEEDPLRENPLDRDRLFKRYQEELIASKKTFITVSGPLEERVQKSKEAILTIRK